MRTLETLVRRGTVAIVWGVGGLGKTSLVLRTLHTCFASEAARAAMVQFRPDADAGEGLRSVLRAVAATSGVRLTSAPGDAADCTEAIVDLAESASSWIVLDDVHHLGPGGALLETLARHARKSRWIATTRVRPPGPELADCSLALEAMPRTDLADLARAIGRRGVDPDDVAARSGGSPWVLRSLVGQPPDGRDPLADLAPEALALLRALASVDLALPAETVAQLGAASEKTMRQLEERGLVEHVAGGLRVHDVARPLVRGAAPDRALAEATIAALAESPSADATLEAIRRLVGEGRSEEAASRLEVSCARILEAGLAPELARVLDRGGAPVRVWRMRAALGTGDPILLAALGEPDRESTEQRVLWARALYLRGEASASARAALDVVADGAAATAPPARPVGGALALEAGLLALEATTLGDEPSDRATYDAIAALPAPPAHEARRLALCGRWQALRGDPAEARRLVAEARERAAPMDAVTRRDVANQAFVVAIALGRIGEAAQLFAELAALSRGNESLDLYASRLALLWHAALSAGLGEPARAGAIVERLRAFAAHPSLQRFIHAAADVHRRLAVGEFAELAPAIDDWVRDAETAGNAHFRDWGRGLAIRVATLEGRERDHAAGPGGYLAALAASHAAVASATRGVAFDARAPAGTEAAVWETIARAYSASGDEADASARSAVAAARELGYVLLEAEAAVALCEVRAIARAEDALRRAASDLAALADRMSSRRFAADARFFAMLASPGPLVPSLLAELAAAASTSPATARRARALLGSKVAMHAFDAKIVAAASTDWRVERREGEPGGWSCGWGLDAHRQEVWLPGGRVVPLAKSPVAWACLASLADRAAGMTKDELVPILWDGESYDPRRHDNRLHPLVNKLRKSIEDDPAHPTRLVTTRDGYRLGTAEPFSRLVLARAG
jgi:hypothetical protein